MKKKNVLSCWFRVSDSITYPKTLEIFAVQGNPATSIISLVASLCFRWLPIFGIQKKSVIQRDELEAAVKFQEPRERRSFTTPFWRQWKSKSDDQEIEWNNQKIKIDQFRPWFEFLKRKMQSDFWERILISFLNDHFWDHKSVFKPNSFVFVHLFISLDFQALG